MATNTEVLRRKTCVWGAGVRFLRMTKSPRGFNRKLQTYGLGRGDEEKQVPFDFAQGRLSPKERVRNDKRIGG